MAAAVLEGLDDSGAVYVLPDRSRTEDADVVFIQRACATAIEDGLANELVGHDRSLCRLKATRGLSCTVAEATVKVHMKSILRKIRVANRTQAAIWALKNGHFSEGIAEEGPRTPKAIQEALSA